MGGKGGFTFLFVQTFLVNIDKPYLTRQQINHKHLYITISQDKSPASGRSFFRTENNLHHINEFSPTNYTEE